MIGGGIHQEGAVTGMTETITSGAVATSVVAMVAVMETGNDSFEKRSEFSGRPRGGNNGGRSNGEAVPRSYQNGGAKVTVNQ